MKTAVSPQFLAALMGVVCTAIVMWALFLSPYS
jgi:hypothetical protein